MDLRFTVFVCVVTLVSAFSRPCHDQTDCHANECCISLIQPIGRRQILNEGRCAPLGHEGTSCLVRYGSATHPPSGMVFGCPCKAGLHCEGSGLIEVPLGEHGKCSHI